MESQNAFVHFWHVFDLNSAKLTPLQIDNRDFTVTGAIDSLTARRIDATEARARGVIVDSGGASPTSPARLRSPAASDSPRSPAPHHDHDDAFNYEYYWVEATGEKIQLLEAIDAGWVFVEYADDQQQFPPEVQVTIATSFLFTVSTRLRHLGRGHLKK